jgi:hypothetical protein
MVRQISNICLLAEFIKSDAPYKASHTKHLFYGVVRQAHQPRQILNICLFAGFIKSDAPYRVSQLRNLSPYQC